MPELFEKYHGYPVDEIAYSTVKDYSDSVDSFPDICYSKEDLKMSQRPWIVKAILSKVEPSSKLLEIGGGEPIVANILSKLGYDVTIVDPYDGTGNGPTEYESYRNRYPDIRFVRNFFQESMVELEGDKYDCIYSISVIEHVPINALCGLMKACKNFINPGGLLINAIDHIVLGNGAEHCRDHLQEVTNNLGIKYSLEQLISDLNNDPDAFFLSATGHLLWKGATPYDEFPFRRVTSINTCTTAQNL